MEEKIHFHAKQISFSLEKEKAIRSWISREVENKGSEIAELNYIFCSDEFLLALNKEYLEHDYYTDILTFPYEHPEGNALWSDIYISVDRIRDNANIYKTTFEDELHRVMIHGVLHLLGFDDHGGNEGEMRRQEELSLAARNFLSPSE